MAAAKVRRGEDPMRARGPYLGPLGNLRRRKMSQSTDFSRADLDYSTTIIGALELSEKKWVLAVQQPGVIPSP
jgi:hypothetical protein